jgi:hypothetical protein
VHLQGKVEFDTFQTDRDQEYIPREDLDQILDQFSHGPNTRFIPSEGVMLPRNYGQIIEGKRVVR